MPRKPLFLTPDRHILACVSYLGFCKGKVNIIHSVQTDVVLEPLQMLLVWVLVS